MRWRRSWTDDRMRREDEAMVVIADEPLYEVVDGQRVEVSHMGARETCIASALLGFVLAFATPKRLGRAVVEVLFDLAPVNRQRRPDLAFVSSQRWPVQQWPPRGENAWRVIPSLAAEVVSPTNTADEVLAKIHDYFQAGVDLVWVVYPDPAEIYVYESPSKVRILTRKDVLDGGTVLPGFQLPLAELFEDVTR